MTHAPLKCPLAKATTPENSGRASRASPAPRSRIYFLTANGNGMRIAARILGVSKVKAISTLRGFEPELRHANRAHLENLGETPSKSKSPLEPRRKWAKCGASSTTSRSSAGFGGRYSARLVHFLRSASAHASAITLTNCWFCQSLSA